MPEGRDYTDELIGALKHPELLTRLRAAWLLGKTGEARAVVPLLEAIENNIDDPYMLQSIVESLGRLGDARALDAIIKLLRNSFIIVRAQAARAIGAIGDLRGLESLLEAKRNDHLSVREAAAEALKMMASSV